MAKETKVIHVDPEQHKQMKQIALDHGTTLDNAVFTVIEKGLQVIGKKFVTPLAKDNPIGSVWAK